MAVLVADIGKAEDSGALQYNIVRIDGQRSVYVPVFKQGGGSNTITIVNGMKEAIKHLVDIPQSLKTEVVFDQSVFVKLAIKNVSKEALMLATPRDAKLVDAIEQLIGQPIGSRRMENLEIREDLGHSRGHPHGERSGHGRRPSRTPRGQSHPPGSTNGQHTPAASQHAAKPHQQPSATKISESPPLRLEQPRAPQRQAREHDAPDLNQLPAFLLRPVKLPPADKPAVRKPKKVAEATP